MEMVTLTMTGLIALASILLACAAWSDIRERRISNRLTLGLTLLGLVFMIVGSTQSPTPLLHIAQTIGVALAVLAGGFGLFAARLMGGGDVKLMAAFALFAGPAYGLPLVVMTTLAGGAVAMVTLAAAKVSTTTVLAYAPSTPIHGDDAVLTKQHSVTVPYGVAIATAGWWICFRLASQTVA